MKNVRNRKSKKRIKPDPQVTIVRKIYADGIENKWSVEGPNSSTYHDSLDMALIELRVILERIEDEHG